MGNGHSVPGGDVSTWLSVPSPGCELRHLSVSVCLMCLSEVSDLLEGMCPKMCDCLLVYVSEWEISDLFMCPKM